MNAPTELPLFPLQTVLFPGALLQLKVFEARYLDMVGNCLRTRQPFGVVALQQGREVRQSAQNVSLESVGVLAELIDVDSEQAGILVVRCRGGARFALRRARQQTDGLWVAPVEALPDDETVAPEEKTLPTVRALANAIGSMKAQGAEPFLQPYRFEDAGWVANRWCEILPIPLAAKQKLMELDEPLIRLQLVDEFLRGRGVLG